MGGAQGYGSVILWANGSFIDVEDLAGSEFLEVKLSVVYCYFAVASVLGGYGVGYSDSVVAKVLFVFTGAKGEFPSRWCCGWCSGVDCISVV